MRNDYAKQELFLFSVTKKKQLPQMLNIHDVCQINKKSHLNKNNHMKTAILCKVLYTTDLHGTKLQSSTAAKKYKMILNW